MLLGLQKEMFYVHSNSSHTYNPLQDERVTIVVVIFGFTYRKPNLVVILFSCLIPVINNAYQ